MKNSDRNQEGPGFLKDLYGIIQNIPDQIYFKDKEGRFLLCNHAVTVNTGVERVEDLIGKTDFDFFPPELAKQYFDDEQKIMREGKPLINKEEQIVNKVTGKVNWNLSTKIPFFDESGSLMGIVGINRDITPIKETQKALSESENLLRELNATKDKFFSIIAHDLKSPFNSIIGLSEILTDDAGTLDTNQIREYAEMIQKSASQTLELLENLLEWAQVQQGTFSFNPERLRLSSLTETVLDPLKHQALSKDINLKNEIEPEIYIFADLNMMKTVMRNLVNNAIKFTHSGGQVLISASRLKDNVQISVADNGVGIKADQIRELFRVDSKVTTRGTRNEKGTGLGLILCKEFITRHQGQIRIESEYGSGSTFFIALPINNSD